MSVPESHPPQSSPVKALPVGDGAPPTKADGTAPFGSHVEPFGKGFKVRLHSPSLRVELLSLGASINSVQVRNPNKKRGEPGEWVETCLGYGTAAECEAPTAVIGVTSGRFAGRIANGEFSLGGSSYKLLQNDGPNTLHGGPNGFQKQQWKYILTEGEEEIGVSFHLTSPHLDQGFPGELFVTATYTIQKSAPAPTIKYVYQANLSDSTPVNATVVNLTNHTYWNLNGVPRALSENETSPLPQSIKNHLLQVKATYIAVTDEQLLPDGEMLAVVGTPYDYSELKCISDGMEATKADGREPWGFDDPIALETWDSTLREAVVLYSPETKLRMTVSTTNPVVVLYTGNFLPEDADGTSGRRFQQHSGVCVETQYFPNSPNIATFPSVTLRKGETYSEATTHQFKFLSAQQHSGTFEPPKA